MKQASAQSVITITKRVMRNIFSIERRNEYSYRVRLFGFKIILTNKQKMLKSKLDDQRSAIIDVINTQTAQIIAAVSDSNNKTVPDEISKIEELQRHITSIMQLYAESYWANVYHDTTVNSTW